MARPALIQPTATLKHRLPILPRQARIVILDQDDNGGILAPGRYPQPVRIIAAPLTYDGCAERRVGRTGVIWRLCGAVFADHVYVNLDLVGAERSEKVAFVELRDVAPIEAVRLEGLRSSRTRPDTAIHLLPSQVGRPRACYEPMT